MTTGTATAQVRVEAPEGIEYVMTVTKPRSKCAPPIIFGYLKAATAEEIAERTDAIRQAAAEQHGTQPQLIFAERQDGSKGFSQFHGLETVIYHRRQQGHQQAIIVIVYERRDIGKTMWLELWFQDKLADLGVGLEFCG